MSSASSDADLDLIVSFQGWEDICRLTMDFPDLFGSLPKDIQKRAEQWHQVRYILGNIL